MDRVIEDFVLALRRSGVAVSTSETLDAVRAVEKVGYGSREALKCALAATLAKSRYEKEIFDGCFDLFFSTVLFPAKPRQSRNYPDVEPVSATSELTMMLLSGDRAGLAVALGEAARLVDMTSIRFFTQKGAVIQKILRRMGLEGLNRDMKALSAVEESADQLRRLQKAKVDLFETVRGFVEKQLDLYAPFAAESMKEQYLQSIRLSNVEQRDLQRMHAIVEKMAGRLITLYSRRRKRSRRGQLDFKKTLRKNIAHQGFLFETRWKAKKVDRPDVVAVCDISRSVSNVTRFFLLFLYTLNELLARIRSFVFCSNLVEVSDIFGGHPLQSAIAQIESGNSLGVSFGLTDYGRALNEFKRDHLGAVSQKTTVIVIGDARNNYDDPRADILKLIAEKSNRIIWLNPENRAMWGSGDSVMLKYVPYCSIARECNTLSHLEKVVRLLF